MNFSEKVYRLAVNFNSKGGARFYERQLLRIRKLRLLYSDPTVLMPVDAAGTKLWMRLSHVLPLLRSANQFYDSIFERLADFLLRNSGSFKMIDVGANIGDSVLLANHFGERCRFLCVEADRRHFAFLERNTLDREGVTRVWAVVADKTESINGALHEHHGTSYFVGNVDSEIRTTTVDNLIIDYPEFKNANLLKVDTDGFDPKVLRGATRLLETEKPVVIFELAPRHYIKAGKEDPIATLEWLRGINYSNVAIYDSSGVLMLYVDLVNNEAFNCVRQLVNFANFNGRYFDILAFHKKKSEWFEEFMASEKCIFEPPLQDCYDLT